MREEASIAAQEAAFEELGAGALAALAPVLTEFRRDVGRLPSLLPTSTALESCSRRLMRSSNNLATEVAEALWTTW